jgi:hypothetical protein
MHINVLRGARQLVSRPIDAKKYAGSEARQFLLTPEMIIDTVHARARGFERQGSKMLAKATLEVVYSVYENKFSGITHETERQ